MLDCAEFSAALTSRRRRWHRRRQAESAPQMMIPTPEFEIVFWKRRELTSQDQTHRAAGDPGWTAQELDEIEEPRWFCAEIQESDRLFFTTT